MSVIVLPTNSGTRTDVSSPFALSRKPPFSIVATFESGSIVTLNGIVVKSNAKVVSGSRSSDHTTSVIRLVDTVLSIGSAFK